MRETPLSPSPGPQDPAFGQWVQDSIQALARASQIDRTQEIIDDQGFGTAALEDVGTDAGDVIQWDGGPKYPAGDGSAITGIAVPAAANQPESEVDSASASATKFLSPLDLFYARNGAGVYGFRNLQISASVAASALTVALKTAAGSDASSTDKIPFAFRNATIATGDQARVNLAAAQSLVISSGSTMGATSSVAFRLWLVQFNDGGTLRLGLVNCLSGVSIKPLQPDGIGSSTAEGGAGAADSAQVIYTGTAVTSKAYVVLGYLEWSSGLGTAGTWSAAPTKVQIFGPGVPLPGQLVQSVRTDTGAFNSGSTGVPYDDTIPQNTEGVQFMSQAITPIGAANLLRVTAVSFCSNSTANHMTSSLYRDSGVNALATAAATNPTGSYIYPFPLSLVTLAGSASATTFNVRSGPDTSNGGTIYFNGQVAARKWGGVLNSFIEIMEIMG